MAPHFNTYNNSKIFNPGKRIKLLPVKIATIDEIKPNKVKVVKVDDADTEAIILNVKGRFYAFQRYCMHKAFPLEFSPKDKMLTCPLHGSKFNIETGKSIGPLMTNDLKTYNVKIKGNEVYLVIGD
jgi:nitrite reductase/ring-hydroxylating ferredoxin subunit